MKKLNILLTLLLCLSHLTWAQGSGEGYNPENPGDPNVYYNLLLEASPRMGGSVSPASRQLGFGESTYCSASAKTGYTFSRWMIGDSVVSTDSYFTFTMPDHAEVLTAYFDYTGYDPANPGDPFADGYRHKVTLYANPSVGGSFNSSSFYMTEGETTRVYAYPRNGYRFASWKKNGVIVSTANPMQITMGQEDLSYIATFVYDPENPGEPAPNMFNPATGELVIDDFKPGYLYEAIRATIDGSENYAIVQSIKIVGAMDEDDLGFAYRLTNCSDIDICRTSGYSEIPSYMFEEMSSLTSVALPASVNTLGNNVFSGCSNLSEIICYAIAPPTVSASTFANMAEGVVVKVPSSSIYLYQQAPIWNQFSFLPLDIETCSITVNLPTDASDGRYKNSTLELKNITSGHSSKYLITDRTSYTFANNIRESQYSVYVKNSSAELLGSIEEVDVDSTSITLTFDSLRQPHAVTIRITTPDGADVTSEVGVKWTNANGLYFSSEKTLSGILEGSLLSTQIELPQTLGTQYATPNKVSHVVNNGSNAINVVLVPLTLKTISGIVLDSTTLQPIYGAVVGASQRLNGKYSSSTNVKVESDGQFSLEIFDVPASFTAAANNYYPKTTSISDTILLSPITGLSVNVSFTYQPSVAAIENTQIVQGYSDYENVYYSVYNVTTGQEVTNLVQRPEQIVLAEVVSTTDILQITAHNRNNSFADVMVETTVMEHGTSIVVPIVELGALHAQYNTAANDNVCGILYDGNGVFVRTIKYKGMELSITQLPDGRYTLVTMGDSPFFKSLLHLSELSASGLVEDVDYVRDTITIQSGVISNLLIADVPYFDERKFYYTGKNTLFSVNKSQVTVGNYVTLRAKVDFLPEYVDSISNVKLIVDIPNGCRFVDNSVLAGSGQPTYTVSGQKIAIDLTNIEDVVRFCINPISSAVYHPSASIQFQLGSREIVQPIGSAFFIADRFTIIVPQKTAFTNVAIGGASFPNSEIHVYDNNRMVATARSVANGDWSCKIDLYNPYSKSYHSIYAEIVAPDGQVYITDTKILEYDKNYAVPSKVKMLYNDQTIVFDMLERSVSAKSYSYNPNINNFTFIGSFTKNDTSIVKNVEFVVLASDGTIRRNKAVYNGSKNAWVAHAIYGNSGQIPTNVVMEYLVTESAYDDKEYINDDVKSVIDLKQNLALVTDSLYEFSVINETDSVINIVVDLDSTIVSTIQLDVLDFQQTRLMMNDVQFEFYYDDENQLQCFKVDIMDNVLISTIIDFADSIAYRITVNDINSNSSAPLRASMSVPRSYKFLDGALNFSTGLLMNLKTAIPYLAVSGDVENMTKMANRYEKLLDDIRQNEVMELLNAKCPDGSYKLNNQTRIAFLQEIQIYLDRDYTFINQMYDYIEEYKTKLKFYMAYDAALSFTGAKAVSAISKATKLKPYAKNYDRIVNSIVNKNNKHVTHTFVGNTLNNVKDLLFGGIIGGVMDGIDHILNPEFADFQSVYVKFSKWAPETYDKYYKTYDRMKYDIKINYETCQKEEEENDEDEDDKHTREVTVTWITPGIQPAIDPSGYVFEGVSSNRVEGATATAYYKEYVEDMYGDIVEKVVLWNAEEFAQENPLFTDAEGKYAWDVPQGLWQVKFEKEGYETTFSEWLPVPPPQLDVNIAMKQYRQPEIKEAHAYQDGVEIEFDKYMQPSLLNTDNIMVTANGTQISGTIQLLDEEVSYEGEETTYASIVRFVPETPFTAQSITLTVSNRVASYADVRMQDNYQQTFDIEQEITSLVVDSLTEVGYGRSKTITVTALPAIASAGKALMVATGGSLIAKTDAISYVLDNRGQAQVIISGDLPGTTGLTFALEGTRLVANTIVKVTAVAEDATYYTITATAEHATITGTGVYETGATATLTVVPDEGYQFLSWSDGNTDNPRTITVTSDAQYEAVCEALITDIKPSERNTLILKQVTNGQLIIIRDGVRYNVLGTRL